MQYICKVLKDIHVISLNFCFPCRKIEVGRTAIFSIILFFILKFLKKLEVKI